MLHCKQTLIYAAQRMENDKLLADYHVPPVCSLHRILITCGTGVIKTCPELLLMQGCQTMIAIETAKLVLGKPDPDSAYWN